MGRLRIRVEAEPVNANCPRVAWSLFFFQAEDGIRDSSVTGVQTCALPIWVSPGGLWDRRPGEHQSGRLAAALPSWVSPCPRAGPVQRWALALRRGPTARRRQ